MLFWTHLLLLGDVALGNGARLLFPLILLMALKDLLTLDGATRSKMTPGTRLMAWEHASGCNVGVLSSHKCAKFMNTATPEMIEVPRTKSIKS